MTFSANIINNYRITVIDRFVINNGYIILSF